MFRITILYISFLLFQRARATTSCVPIQTDNTKCDYTVTCIAHPGTVSGLTCNYGEPSVTFIIDAAVVDRLTGAFFGATNFDSKVRIIKFSDSGLNSIEKRAFGYYTKATEVDLSHSRISNVQSDAFNNMVSLKHLNLSHNIIRNIYQNSFRVSENQFSNIEVLDLSYLYLTALSEDMFIDVPYVKKLYLQSNRLQTITDDCFKNLIHLQLLTLDYNLLESLNLTLFHLEYLQYLSLSYNSLNKLQGYEIGKLKSLQQLDISHNGLECFGEDTFKQSNELKTLDLSYNYINCTIKNGMFIGTSKLSSLNLYHNHITSIEENSLNLNNLEELNLTRNSIRGEIKTFTFAGLWNVPKLDISQQNITALRNKAFSDMKHLGHLNLSRNYIILVENSTFFNSSIYILDLSFNNISQLNFLQSLTNLTDLYLNSNNIKILYKNTFVNLKLLTRLDLSDNKIVNIEPNTLPLSNLQYLNITKNKLIGTISADVFSPVQTLRYLDLSGFNITKIDQSAFIDMPVLVRLNLSHNAIEYINKHNFKHMNNMYSLDLSYNKINVLTLNITDMKNLKSVYLNHNNLSNVTEIFTDPSNITYLDLANNVFSNTSEISSKLFPELQVLDLSKNNISNFNNMNTNTLSNLSDLKLAFNNITNIDLSYFKNLVLVDLSGNNITVINNIFFGNISNLQYLDLSHNKILDVIPGTFQNMNILKFVNLSNNLINEIRFGSFKGLHEMELLDISYNNIEYLNELVFHECIRLRTLIIDYNHIKNLDVETLIAMTQSRLTILSIGGNPLSCHEIVRKKTLKEFNDVNITSIHKIYHEDNVHGILCGDKMQATTEKKGDETSDDDTNSNTKTIVFSVLGTILIIAVTVLAGIYYVRNKRKDDFVKYRESRAHIRSSLELSTSDLPTFG